MEVGHLQLVILWSENKWNLPKSNEVNDAPSQLALGTEAPGDINMWMSTRWRKLTLMTELMEILFLKQLWV
jgi:hypothetical protein